MDKITGRSRFNETGMLTLGNRAVALIDLHPPMLLTVGKVDRQPVISNNLLLAKAALGFHKPTFAVFTDANRRGQQS